MSYIDKKQLAALIPTFEAGRRKALEDIARDKGDVRDALERVSLYHTAIAAVEATIEKMAK